MFKSQSALDYSTMWKLTEPVLIKSRFTSKIYRVQFQNAAAILKLFNENCKQTESISSLTLRCFGSHGAVKLLKSDGGAHLLEFISGRSLVSLVAESDDEGATQIICEIIEKLHSYSTTPFMHLGLL
jgi:streptomycin 6-kinase